MRITKLDIQIRTIDNDSATPWNINSTVASKEANQALYAAVDAATEAVRREGFTVLGVSYGTSSEDYE